MLAALDVALHQSMPWRLPLTLVLASLPLVAIADDAALEACVPSGGGRLEMTVTGLFDARVEWGNEGTRCDGGPRPAGDALRLMFSRDDQALLVVIAITGVAPGVTGSGLPADLTLVRQGTGEFYGTLGERACTVDVELNQPENGVEDAWQIGGKGRCDQPVEAIGRDGEVRVAPFAFSGIAHWPEEGEAD